MNKWSRSPFHSNRHCRNTNIPPVPMGMGSMSDLLGTAMVSFRPVLTGTESRSGLVKVVVLPWSRAVSVALANVEPTVLAVLGMEIMVVVAGVLVMVVVVVVLGMERKE